MSRWDRAPRDLTDESNYVSLHPNYHSATRHRLGQLGDILRGVGRDVPIRRSDHFARPIHDFPYDGATRREANHQRWEDSDPIGAIKSRWAEALRQAVLKLRVERNQPVKKQVRHQRNNRREY